MCIDYIHLCHFVRIEKIKENRFITRSSFLSVQQLCAFINKDAKKYSASTLCPVQFGELFILYVYRSQSNLEQLTGNYLYIQVIKQEN